MNLIIFLAFSAVRVNLNFTKEHIIWKWDLRNFSNVKINSFYPLTYIGPEGGTILYPITSEVNLKKVVLPSFLEFHKCEDVFAGDTFEIAIPYSGFNFRLGKSGVMISSNTFLLLRDSLSFYFTDDNFATLNIVSLNSKIGALDALGSTIYIISGDSLLRSDNGGYTFNFISDLENYLNSGNYNYVIDVFPFNQQVIAIAAYGQANKFLISTDGGNNFSVYNLPFSGDIYSLRFSPQNQNVIFLDPASGGVLYTTDAGVTWNNVNLIPNFPLYPGFIIDILPLNSDTFLISSVIDRGIFKAYRTFGNNFSYSYLDTTLVPFFFEPTYRNSKLNDTFYIGSNDGVYYTVNRGNTWTRYKNRLKAVLLWGPGQVTSKKDTTFLITDGGIVYRSFDLINSSFSELSFKGNLIFFGNNLVENFYFSSKSLYLLTSKFRIFASPFQRVLFFSNNTGENFTLKNSDGSLVSYYDILPGSNTNTLYLWNDSTLIKSSDGGITFDTIYSGLISSVAGEGDTIFVLKNSDTLYASFDGLNFSALTYLPDAGELYYVKGSPFVFYSNTFKNYLMSYDLNNSIIDTAIKRPNNSSILIHSSLSYDGYIYSLFLNNQTGEKNIYYRKIPDGNINSVPINLENPVGIFALEGGYVLIYEMGRGLYIIGVTSVAERNREDVKLLYITTLVRNNLEIKGFRGSINYGIYDITGKRLLSGNISSTERVLNLNNFKSGTYYIKLNNKIYKFIKF
ncbi:MAG: hypothetical protein ABIN20_00690 [candidate division WOR-3 bacterium]